MAIDLATDQLLAHDVAHPTEAIQPPRPTIDEGPHPRVDAQKLRPSSFIRRGLRAANACDVNLVDPRGTGASLSTDQVQDDDLLRSWFDERDVQTC